VSNGSRIYVLRSRKENKMEIGTERETITIEPVVEPVPNPDPAPSEPEYEPAETPAETPAEEPVPA